MGAALGAALQLVLSNPAILTGSLELATSAVNMVVGAFHMNHAGVLTDDQLAAIIASVAAKDKASTDSLDAIIAAHKAWKATLPTKPA